MTRVYFGAIGIVRHHARYTEIHVSESLSQYMTGLAFLHRGWVPLAFVSYDTQQTTGGIFIF